MTTKDFKIKKTKLCAQDIMDNNNIRCVFPVSYFNLFHWLWYNNTMVYIYIFQDA